MVLQEIICDQCGQCVSGQLHSKSCKNHIKFECSVCLKCFSSQKLLKQHFRTHYKPQFKCKICSKEFKAKQNIRNHIKFVHTLCPSDNVCHICDSRFTTSKSLKRHLKIHSEMLYHCPKCFKNFHFKYNKDNHVKTCSQTL